MDAYISNPGKNPILQDPPFDTPRPPFLPDCDDRFNKCKRLRVYACDTCPNLVSFSSWTRSNSLRAHGEYQGSYFDSTWAGSIPGELLMRAYTSRLIDCTWRCSEFCGAPPMGVKDRETRTTNWRAKNSRQSSWVKLVLNVDVLVRPQAMYRFGRRPCLLQHSSADEWHRRIVFVWRLACIKNHSLSSGG